MTDPQSTSRSAAAQNAFERESMAVLQRLRSAFQSLIGSLPGPVHRAADLERALSLSTKLAWQIHRVANSANPLAASEHVPGIVAVRQMLEAASRVGVPEMHLRTVDEAMHAFERLVKSHAGNRTAFTSMVIALVGSGCDVLDLQARRAAFRTNSLIWGMSSKTILSTKLYLPGRSTECYDIVSVRGTLELTRYRRDVTPTLMGRAVSSGSGGTHKHVVNELKQADAGRGDSAASELLSPFCSQPKPRLSHRRAGNYLVTVLDEQPIGRVGAFTYFLADYVPGNEWRDEHADGRRITMLHGITKPTEALHVEALFYDGMFGSLTPCAAAYANAARPISFPSLELTECDRLPFRVNVNSVGFGSAALHLPGYPRYLEMIDHVCKRMDLDIEKFEVYRCRVEYPVLHSQISVTFPLPESVNW